MAIRGALYKAILEKSKMSQPTISRWATELMRVHGPMTPDEARLVMAHDLKIDLNKYPLTDEQLDRVRTLRAAGASLASVLQRTERREPAEAMEEKAPTREPEGRPISPAALFASRQFHAIVTRRSKRLFAGGHRTEAISAAFRSVNNRVKKLSRLRGEDGASLMGKAFKDSNPPLQMSDLSTQSGQDEHKGTQLLMMGAMTGIRNPRAHEDRWEPDDGLDSVLECLAFASLLHRFLDRCEAYRQGNAP